MRTHARAASIAIAGAALLAASALTAAPALAAPTVLTQATCEGPGGTFTVDKALKTCVTVQHLSYDYDDGPWQDSSGDFTAVFTIHYTGTYDWQITQTQKGKGPIKTAAGLVVEGSVSGTSYLVDQQCSQYVSGAPGDGYVPVDVSFCEDLNLYPVF